MLSYLQLVDIQTELKVSVKFQTRISRHIYINNLFDYSIGIGRRTVTFMGRESNKFKVEKTKMWKEMESLDNKPEKQHKFLS